FSSLSQLRQTVQGFGPDVVHAWGRASLRALLVAGFGGRRIISPCPEPDVKRSWLRLLDGRLLRKAAHVVAFGEVEAARCRLLGARREQLVVVQPAVRAEEGDTAAIPGVAEGTRFILCVGRLLPHKGFLEAIWSVDIVRYVNADLQLLIAGEGPDRPRLEDFLRSLEAVPSVHLLGEVPEGFSLMRRAEGVWAPGRVETGTQIILEAMALGKPVIASRFPRTAELIADGETGLLVSPEDKAQLARQTQKLLADAGLRTQLGEVARRRVQERHRPEALAETCMRLYRG